MTEVSESLAWFRLFSTRGLGPKRLRYIYDAARHAALPVGQIFFLEWADFSKRFPWLDKDIFHSIHSLDLDVTDRNFDRLLDVGIRLVHLGDVDYPDILLRRMDTNAPPILFGKGNLSLLQSGGVAIVGARNPSPTSLLVASEIAGQLARSEMNVISGYAGGIDTESHLGALQADGTTTIVLSFGILEFAKKKAFEGVDWKTDVLILSQFHPVEKWNARNAMVRNRVVCGLSQAVVVIESGLHQPGKMSGTFDAGLTALQMNVPLFVIDPYALDARLPGNEELVKRGGVTVEPEHAVEEILKHPQVRCSPSAPPPPALQPPLF